MYCYLLQDWWDHRLSQRGSNHQLKPSHHHLLDCFNNPGKPGSNKQGVGLTDKSTLLTFLGIRIKLSPDNIPRFFLGQLIRICQLQGNLNDFSYQIPWIFFNIALEKILRPKNPNREWVILNRAVIQPSPLCNKGAEIVVFFPLIATIY